MSKHLKKALFLDRDGTINIDTGYISDPAGMRLLPRAAQAIRKARQHGYTIVVISNQSGVGRGLIAPEMLPKIHEHLNEMLEAECGARVDYFACCTHRPEEECKCRKPLPRLVYEAQAHLDLDLKQSALIGDRVTDIQTGKSAPVGFTILVRTGEGAEQEKKLGALVPDHIAGDLDEAVDWLLGQN